MSAAVFQPAARQHPRRPSWTQTAGAVLGGTLVAWAITVLWILPLAVWNPFAIGQTGAPGHGWPWRIDGPWSLAADAGPLLLCGLALAFGVESFTVRWTGTRPLRLPLVLLAAALGWVTFPGGDRGGLVVVDGLVAFAALVVVARECSVRERAPRRRSRAGAALVVLAILVLAAASLSYGVLHPVSAAPTDVQSVPVRHGRAELFVPLENGGRLGLRVLGVEVPGATLLKARTDNEAVSEAPTIEGLQKPLAGSFIAGHGDRVAYLTVAAPACGAVVDRVGVRLRVAGRTVHQVVRFDDPVRLVCARPRVRRP